MRNLFLYIFFRFNNIFFSFGLFFVCIFCLLMIVSLTIRRMMILYIFRQYICFWLQVLLFLLFWIFFIFFIIVLLKKCLIQIWWLLLAQVISLFSIVYRAWLVNHRIIRREVILILSNFLVLFLFVLFTITTWRFITLLRFLFIFMFYRTILLYLLFYILILLTFLSILYRLVIFLLHSLGFKRMQNKNLKLIWNKFVFNISNILWNFKYLTIIYFWNNQKTVFH